MVLSISYQEKYVALSDLLNNKTTLSLFLYLV